MQNGLMLPADIPEKIDNIMQRIAQYLEEERPQEYQRALRWLRDWAMGREPDGRLLYEAFRSVGLVDADGRVLEDLRAPLSMVIVDDPKAAGTLMVKSLCAQVRLGNVPWTELSGAADDTVFRGLNGKVDWVRTLKLSGSAKRGRGPGDDDDAPDGGIGY